MERLTGFLAPPNRAVELESRRRVVGTGSPSGSGDRVDLSADEGELTVLYYLNGQSTDIQLQTANEFLGIERLAPGPGVKLAAQLGRENNYDLSSFKYSIESNAEENYRRVKEAIFHIPVDSDWKGVRRYEIRHDSHETAEIPSREYVKLVDGMPHNPYIYYSAAKALWREGDKVSATRYFEQADALGIRDVLSDPESDSSLEIIEEFKRRTRKLDKSWFGKRDYTSKPVEKLDPQTKMSRPETLRDFISWGMKKFPARHYVLVMGGHGGGWWGWGGHYDNMDPRQMAQAIRDGASDASKETGKERKVDALVFNSCYMGNLEAVESLKDAADTALLSENYVNGGGLDSINKYLDKVFRDVERGTPFDPHNFAIGMVSEVREEEREIREKHPQSALWRGYFHTLTATDNRKIHDLTLALKDLVVECKKSGFTYGQLHQYGRQAKGYGFEGHNSIYKDFRDLGGILYRLRTGQDVPSSVRASACEVSKALSEAILDEQHEGVGMEGSQGLTLWVPDPEIKNEENGKKVLEKYDIQAADFNGETGWSRWLRAPE